MARLSADILFSAEFALITTKSPINLVRSSLFFIGNVLKTRFIATILFFSSSISFLEIK